MKALKFKPHLVPQVLDGTKTTTWRLFDDKDLQTGDHIECINSETGAKFTEVKISNVEEKKLGEIDDSDFDGHEKYESLEDMVNHYKSYYSDKVDLDTVVKIVTFKLVK
jgi:hypothetical protein